MMRIVLNRIKEVRVFNLNIVLEVLAELAYIFALAYVWKFFGYKDGIKYFLIVNFAAYLSVGWELLWKMDRLVRRGKLNGILVYPINPLSYLIFDTIGQKFSFDFVICSILFVIIIYYLGIKAILVLLASILSFFFGLFFTLSFFYVSIRTEGAYRIFGFFNRIIKWMLSGAIIPIDFLKRTIPLYDLLPFKYFSGIAYEVLENPSTIFYGILWLLIFTTISLRLYKKALKHYYAYGG